MPRPLSASLTIRPRSRCCRKGGSPWSPEILNEFLVKRTCLRLLSPSMQQQVQSQNRQNRPQTIQAKTTTGTTGMKSMKQWRVVCDDSRKSNTHDHQWQRQIGVRRRTICLSALLGERSLWILYVEIFHVLYHAIIVLKIFCHIIVILVPMTQFFDNICDNFPHKKRKISSSKNCNLQ